MKTSHFIFLGSLVTGIFLTTVYAQAETVVSPVTGEEVHRPNKFVHSQQRGVKMTHQNNQPHKEDPTIWEQTKETTNDAWEATKSGASAAWDKTKEVSGEAWDATKSGASAAWDKTKEVTSDAWDATKSGAAAAWDKTKEVSGEAWDAVTGSDDDDVSEGYDDTRKTSSINASGIRNRGLNNNTGNNGGFRGPSSAKKTSSQSAVGRSGGDSYEGGCTGCCGRSGGDSFDGIQSERGNQNNDSLQNVQTNRQNNKRPNASSYQMKRQNNQSGDLNDEESLGRSGGDSFDGIQSERGNQNNDSLQGVQSKRQNNKRPNASSYQMKGKNTQSDDLTNSEETLGRSGGDAFYNAQSNRVDSQDETQDDSIRMRRDSNGEQSGRDDMNENTGNAGDSTRSGVSAAGRSQMDSVDNMSSDSSSRHSY